MREREPKLPGPLAGLAIACCFPFVIAFAVVAGGLTAVAMRAFSRAQENGCSRRDNAVSREDENRNEGDTK